METVGLKNSDLMKVELNMSVYGIGYGITHYFDHKLLDSLPQEFLRECWEEMTDKPVLLSGPAYDNSAGDFVPGRYIKKRNHFYKSRVPQ